MISATGIHAKFPAPGQAAQLGARATALLRSGSYLQWPSAGLRVACAIPQQHHLAPRCFSTTRERRLRGFFPAKPTPHIETTPPSWPHPGYTMEEMKAVVPAHRRPETWSDWVAWKIVRFARYWMDKVTGMDRAQKFDKSQPTTSTAAAKPLTEEQWVSHLQAV